MDFNHLIPHFKLSQPLEYIHITQPFGANEVPYYAEQGFKGHTGNDYRAETGTPFFAVIDGICLKSGQDSQQGRYVIIESEVKAIDGKSYKIQVLYYHIQQWEVMAGEKVYRGQRLGTTDNTGRYTTAPHLHLTLTPLWLENGIWSKDYNNGYRGSINPQPFFTYMGQQHNPYGLPQNTLVQLTEGIGGFALFAQDKDGNDRFFIDDLAKIQASWLVRNKGDIKGKTLAIAQVVWNAYKPIWRNLKNEPVV